MRNRIHILGASGSGATTLGNELTFHLPHANLMVMIIFGLRNLLNKGSQRIGCGY